MKPLDIAAMSLYSASHLLDGMLSVRLHMRSGGHRPFVQPARESAGEAFFIGVEMKTCTKCFSIKPEGEFYAHANTKDGLRGECKECTKYLAKAWQSSNQEKEKARSAKWAAEHPEKAKAKVARYRARNPDVVRAHIAVRTEIRAGRMIRGACEVCGSSEHVHAHHDDYSKPLSVRWLCQPHHVAIHARTLGEVLL